MSTPTQPPTPPASARSAPRATATFTPYYWEAYNEITERNLFDRYLIRKWLPDLGQTGFAIVKILRDRCYFNPGTGQRRDQVEMRMDELARLVGVSRSMIFKVFAENKALGHFVRRIEQYQFADGKPRRDANLYQVCMDDPIHPDDLQRYEDLRALKEAERDTPPIKRVFKGSPKGENTSDSYESTTETHRETDQKPAAAYESTTRTHRDEAPSYESTTRTADTTYLSSAGCTADTTYLGSASGTAIDNLPPGLLTKDSLTPVAASRKREGDPPIYAPQGAGDPESPPSPLTVAWSLALAAVEPTLTRPTFGLHVTRLVPRDLIDLPDGSAELVVEAPSALSREWVQVRAIPEALAESLSDSLGRPVTVRMTQLGALASAAPVEAATGAAEAKNHAD